MHVTDG